MIEEDVEEFLEHFGVKGMKWGVRNQKRLERAKRVASGKASRGERTRFLLTDSSRYSVKKNKGLEGAARSRVIELEARKKRIKAGKATVKDLIALRGGDRLWITGKQGRVAPKSRENFKENRNLALVAAGTLTAGLLLRAIGRRQLG